VRALSKQLSIAEVAFDAWNATQLATELQDDGATMVKVGQGFASLSAPAKELEKLVKAGRLRHGGNPVLRWCAANAVVEQDAAGNIKPSKRKSTERIDGVVALVMALDRATRREGESVYNQRARRGERVL
jgi:phage terminase large subunit-like protein